MLSFCHLPIFQDSFYNFQIQFLLTAESFFPPHFSSVKTLIAMLSAPLCFLEIKIVSLDFLSLNQIYFPELPKIYLYYFFDLPIHLFLNYILFEDDLSSSYK